MFKRSHFIWLYFFPFPIKSSYNVSSYICHNLVYNDHFLPSLRGCFCGCATDKIMRCTACILTHCVFLGLHFCGVQFNKVVYLTYEYSNGSILHTMAFLKIQRSIFTFKSSFTKYSVFNNTTYNIQQAIFGSFYFAL